VLERAVAANDNKPLSVPVGIMMVVLTLVGWSSVPLFLRHFAESIDFWTSNGWRYGFSALIWLPVLIVAAMRRGLPKGLWQAALIPSIANALGQACFTWAHYRISPGLLTFGLRTQLLFVAIGAWILFPRERAIIRTRTYHAGAVLLIAGTVAVVAGAPTSSAHTQAVSATGASWGTTADHFIGVGLALASGLLFALYGLAVRKYMEGINSVLAFAAICQYTAGVMVALMLLFAAGHGMSAFELPGSEIIWLLLSAIIGIAIGHVFYYMSIARLGVSISAGVLQLQPFFVALASVWLLPDVAPLTTSQWLGGTVAVLGAVLMLSVQWHVSRKKRISVAPLAIAEGESGG
jgi:drug/metabolite transporter (DMT)-like permease